MVGRGRGVGWGIRVGSDPLIGDISDISIVVVGGVLDVLGTAIGKSNIIRSRDNTGSISSLSSVEVSLGVVISNSVLVGVGFINISWFNISWGSVDGSISWSSVDYRGVVDNWGMVDSMGNGVSNKSMVGNWVGNDSMVKSMGYWVGNDSMVKSMGSNNSMVSKVRSMAAMGDNSTMSMADHMGRYIRGGGSGSKAKKSGNNESLHFCSIVV